MRAVIVPLVIGLGLPVVYVPSEAPKLRQTLGGASSGTRFTVTILRKGQVLELTGHVP